MGLARGIRHSRCFTDCSRFGQGLTVNPGLPLRESEEFHLSCIVGVGQKRDGLSVAWIKDAKYIVNTTAAKRSVHS